MSLSRRRFLEAYKERGYIISQDKYEGTSKKKRKPPSDQETVEEWLAKNPKNKPKVYGYCVKSKARQKTFKEMQTIKQRGEITYEESKRRK